MSEPSLRELLLPFKDCDKDIRQAVYALLEAVFGAAEVLVERVAPEDTDVHGAIIRELRAKLTEERGQGLADIVRLCKERDMFEQNWKDTAAILSDAVKAHDKTIDEAKAETGSLRESRDWWKRQCENNRRDITRLQGITSAQGPYIEELKAEIKQLHKELVEARAGQWCESEQLCKGYPGLCAEAETVVKSIKADAEKWQLVLGMAIDTKIRHHHPKVYRDPIFTVYRWDNRLMTFVNVTWSPDPAKVLAAIQEVADDRNPC